MCGVHIQKELISDFMLFFKFPHPRLLKLDKNNDVSNKVS